MDEDRTNRISERAHRIWLDEGQPEGQAEAHWSRAEAEVGPDREAIAAETDYVMQDDAASHVATQLDQGREGPDVETNSPLDKR